MKLRNLFFAAAIATLGLASCSSDEDSNLVNPNDHTVRFSSVIGEMNQTRAAGTQWSANDKIGIFMKRNNQILSSENIVGGAENIQYVTPVGSGNFEAASVSETIKMPEDGSLVDFIAYYPYKSTISTYTYPINIQNQLEQESIDLLYSDQATANDKTNPYVTLNFKHKLSKVIFNVKAGEGVSSLDGLSTVISGLKTKAGFSLVDASLALDHMSVTDIALKTTTSATGMISEGIVIPETNLNNVVVRFSIPGAGTFKVDLASGINFEKGKKYTFNVELKEGGEVVFINPNGVIEDWVDGTTTNLSLEKEEIPGEGTKASPYNISQLSSKVGETEKWVEGYVVGVSTSAKSINWDGSTTIKTNILLASKADETNISKCVAIDLEEGSDIQKSLNLADNPTLLGSKVKVQGTIASNLFGVAVAMIAVSDQEGGVLVGGNWEVIFSETFGTAVVTSKPKFGNYTGYDNAGSVTFSGVGDVRLTSTFNNHAWLPMGNANLKIAGINTDGYKSIRLSYDLTANLFSTTAVDNVKNLQVKCGDVYLFVPDFDLKRADYQNAYYTVSIDNLPLGFSILEFVTSVENNLLGFRLDNIKLEGIK